MSIYYKCDDGQGGQTYVLLQGMAPRCNGGAEWVTTEQLTAEILQEPALQEYVESMGYPGMMDLIYIGIAMGLFAHGWTAGVASR